MTPYWFIHPQFPVLLALDMSPGAVSVVEISASRASASAGGVGERGDGQAAAPMMEPEEVQVGMGVVGVEANQVAMAPLAAV